MRTTPLVCLLALMFGCRTQPLDRPISDDFGTTNNMSRDMAVSRFDMAVSNGGDCAALLECLGNCGTEQCQNDCYNAASFEAQDVLTQALQCIYGFCQKPNGNRAPRCDENFEDFGDGGVGRCDACLTNAFAGLGGYECMPRNSPDCSPAECQPFVEACTKN